MVTQSQALESHLPAAQGGLTSPALGSPTTTTQYDYYQGKRDVLSHDGRNPDIVIVRSIATNLLNEMGAAGRLKGTALEDYKKGEAHGRPE